MRYFFEITYNGARYSGWQSQHNANSIQDVVEDCLSRLLREKIGVVASGRTDAGVHCEQQFFHSDITTEVDTALLLHRFNSILPPDIVIRNIFKVRSDAHARYDAFERTYIYRITRKKNPFKNGLALYFFKDLDIQTMNEAAALLVGKHDFECFSKVKTEVNNFICEVKEAVWNETEEKLDFTITSNRFLRGMVRAIVGTLLDVGQGRTSLREVNEILNSRDRRAAGANVPPYGLYLTRVQYPENIYSEGNGTNK